jgi:hypothetical protein
MSVGSPQSELGPGGRGVAAVLAVVWIGAGATAIVVGVRRGSWLQPLLGAFALAYGVLWARVARTGVRLRWPRQSRSRNGSG